MKCKKKEYSKKYKKNKNKIETKIQKINKIETKIQKNKNKIGTKLQKKISVSDKLRITIYLKFKFQRCIIRFSCSSYIRCFDTLIVK